MVRAMLAPPSQFNIDNNREFLESRGMCPARTIYLSSSYYKNMACAAGSKLC